MKLAEALIERAEIKKKNGRLISRIKSNILVQEGDEPAENYYDLTAEYEENMNCLLSLTQRINKTNSKTPFDANMNVADAIILRDWLGGKSRMYREVYEDTAIKPDRYRYGKNEVRFVRCINVKEMQSSIDRLAKEYREIDTKIQGINWTVDLL